MKHDNITMVISQDRDIILDQKSIVTVKAVQSGDDTYINITNSYGDIYTVATYSYPEAAASEIDRYIDETIHGDTGVKFFMFS